MKIIRRTNILVKTERKFIVQQEMSNETINCENCGAPMKTAQANADSFGVSSRLIYRLIESGKIHYAETAANEIYVCSISLREILKAIG